MKIVVLESQYKRLIETEEEQGILQIPSLKFFNNDWYQLQEFLESKGNPPYSVKGDLRLIKLPIKSLGNLQSVGGNLDLYSSEVESLGNLQSVGGDFLSIGTPLESLGNLVSVGGGLNLNRTQIKSLGNLRSVGGYLSLTGTPLSQMYTKKKIRDMVNVGGKIYLLGPFEDR